ncbi:Acetyltransferase (GNAT) domain-containing protein [Arachidicoccus rhizosphaerae]|uniref:Acetyltransferase (GNAT) domain-containing protein n=1 Tax=Arachidicoccus rhizosphaerae TaxID=551991 RepID=A0A1H4C6A0_9BACT|nr:GNAT family N-acetyltransferase [Arachidicoccus rhizosphaerae]SEA55876.1 Acetyltransferase (GNAT) domain-containing protein [Arachidicoccus rhizosphaerae]
MNIILSETRKINKADIIQLYKANSWSAAQKPEALYNGLMNAHALISAWDDDQLIGLGNAISDGHLVVYYPHLLVHPAYQRHGVGQQIMIKLQEKYTGFHMQILTADNKAINFYKKMGFTRAGSTIPMWIYKGKEH